MASLDRKTGSSTSTAPTQRFIITTLLSSIVLIVVIALVVMEVITVPFLSPAIRPLRPYLQVVYNIIKPPLWLLWPPLSLGTCLKIHKHPGFPRKASWRMASGSMFMQQLGPLITKIGTLFTSEDDVCGLKECWSAWLTLAWLIIIPVATWRDWRWELGYIDKLVNQLAAESWAEETKKNVADIEAGTEQEDGSADGAAVLRGSREKA